MLKLNILRHFVSVFEDVPLDPAKILKCIDTKAKVTLIERVVMTLFSN